MVRGRAPLFAPLSATLLALLTTSVCPAAGQPLPERVYLIGKPVRRAKMQKADHRHRLPLCAYSRTRTGDRHTA